MGKLKISKAKKSRSEKGTSGIPNWLLSTIIIVVVVAVLAVCITTALFSNGVIGRWSMAMRTDEFKVNQNMMAYFFRTNYINTLNNMSQYVQEDSDLFTSMGIDVTKSLKEQISFDGKTSWYDYLLNTTKTQVKNLLIYASAAKDAGVKLEDEDQAQIDATLESTILTTAYSLGIYGGGYSNDAICSMAFGEGVSEGDVRDALELQHLASKYSNLKGDSITGNVKDDNDRIDKTYNDDKKLFNYVDYLSFSFTVSYEDIIKEKYPDKTASTLTDDEKSAVLAAYKEEIEAAKKNATELAGKTTVAEYNAFIAEFTANKEYAELYNKAVKDLKSEVLPSEENIKTIKDKIIANVLAEIAENKTEATDDVKTTDAPAAESAEGEAKTADATESEETKSEGATDSAETENKTEDTKKYSIYDIEITKEFADAIKSFKNSLFSTVYIAIDTANSEKISYTEPAEGVETAVSWAFGADRKELDSKVFESGDGANDAEVKPDTTSFSAQVALLTKPSYRIETLSRDFAYLLFAKQEEATEAIEAIKKIEGLDKDKFLALASAEGSTVQNSQFVEDCVVGSMRSDKLDEWLFSEETKEGAYTAEPIVMSDRSLMVALYVKQNTTPEWEYQVTNYLVEKDYTAFETEITNKYSGQVQESSYVLGKLKDTAYAY